MYVNVMLQGAINQARSHKPIANHGTAQEWRLAGSLQYSLELRAGSRALFGVWINTISELPPAAGPTRTLNPKP